MLFEPAKMTIFGGLIGDSKLDAHPSLEFKKLSLGILSEAWRLPESQALTTSTSLREDCRMSAGWLMANKPLPKSEPMSHITAHPAS